MSKELYSFTKVQTYVGCPKKFYYNYRRRLYPKRKAPPLSLGGCMAEGVNVFRKTGNETLAREAFMEQWVIDGRILAIKKEDDEMRSVERALEILDEYMMYYPEDPTETVQPEVKFKEDLGDFIFRGRIDGIFQSGGGITIMEDKTMSRLGPATLVEVLGGWQVCWYMGIAKILGLFDIEKKNQIPRCTVNAIYIHPKIFRFQREITVKSNKTLDKAMDQLRNWVKVIEMAIERDIFPMADSDRCNKYGGCDFKRICAASEGRAKESILAADFEIREPH